MLTDVVAQITGILYKGTTDIRGKMPDIGGLLGWNRLYTELAYISWVKNRFEQGLFYNTFIKLKNGGEYPWK